MKLARSTVFLFVLIFNCGCSFTKLSSSRVGAADAQLEIQSGTLALEEYGFGAGLPSVSDDYLSSLGVEIRPVAGCLVDDEIIGHASGFNREMRREIKDRFGSNVFKLADQQKSELKK